MNKNGGRNRSYRFPSPKTTPRTRWLDIKSSKRTRRTYVRFVSLSVVRTGRLIIISSNCISIYNFVLFHRILYTSIVIVITDFIRNDNNDGNTNNAYWPNTDVGAHFHASYSFPSTGRPSTNKTALKCFIIVGRYYCCCCYCYYYSCYFCCYY